MTKVPRNKKLRNGDLVKVETHNADPLDVVELDEQQTVGVLGKATVATVTSGVLGVLGLGKVFEWIERVDQASREEKLKTLLMEYGAHFESFDDAISRLKLLTNTRGGQTLFRKIIQIVDKGNKDQEWIHLLSMTLKKIIEGEFEKYFDAQMFVLSQIDRLSPQALILLSKFNVWKEVHIQGTTTTSGKTQGDWIPQVTMFMRQKLGFENLEVGARVNHSFRELESMGMVDLKGHELKLTAIALEIHRHITA